MKNGQEELATYLLSTLTQLNSLSQQIIETKDYSKRAELILTLKELILEQVHPPQESYSKELPAQGS